MIICKLQTETAGSALPGRYLCRIASGGATRRDRRLDTRLGEYGHVRLFTHELPTEIAQFDHRFALIGCQFGGAHHYDFEQSHRFFFCQPKISFFVPISHLPPPYSREELSPARTGSINPLSALVFVPQYARKLPL